MVLVLFQLIFLNKTKSTSCPDLSPNRPFQELKMKQHGHFLNYQGDGFSFLVILIFSCSSLRLLPKTINGTYNLRTDKKRKRLVNSCLFSLSGCTSLLRLAGPYFAYKTLHRLNNAALSCPSNHSAYLNICTKVIFYSASIVCTEHHI